MAGLSYLPALARRIVGELARFLAAGSDGEATGLGEELAAQGLGLRSWLAVGRALARDFAAGAGERAGSDDAAAVLARQQQPGQRPERRQDARGVGQRVTARLHLLANLRETLERILLVDRQPREHRGDEVAVNNGSVGGDLLVVATSELNLGLAGYSGRMRRYPCECADRGRMCIV